MNESQRITALEKEVAELKRLLNIKNGHGKLRQGDWGYVPEGEGRACSGSGIKIS
jgi:hypothetical protein